MIVVKSSKQDIPENKLTAFKLNQYKIKPSVNEPNPVFAINRCNQ